MLSTPEEPQPPGDAAASGALPGKEPGKRRSHRKKPGRRGKHLVLFMVFLVLGYIGLSAFLSFARGFHPFVEKWNELTLWITYGLVTMVVLLCLIRVYRGSMIMKQLIGGLGVVAAFTFAIFATVSVLNELPVLWIVHDSLGFFTGAFVAWTCFYSRTASRFLALQADKPQ